MPRTRKTGSKAERDALRQEMLVGGCSLELISAEMERRWGFRPREAYRHAHGWSQDEVAARFTEVAERLGGERDRVADGRPVPPAAPMIGTRIGEYERWPHGGRRPSPYVLTVLATVLGTTVERLLDYDDHRSMPDQERMVLAAVLAASAPPVPPAAPATPLSPSPGTGVGGPPAAGRLPAPGRRPLESGPAGAGPIPSGPRPVRAVPAPPGGQTEVRTVPPRSTRRPPAPTGRSGQTGRPGSAAPAAPAETSGQRGRAGQASAGSGPARTPSATTSAAPTTRPARAARAVRAAQPADPPGRARRADPADPAGGADRAAPAQGTDPAGPTHTADVAHPEDGIHPVDAEPGAARLPDRILRPAPPPLPEAPVVAMAMDQAAPEGASAARRHRRDRLLSGPPGIRTEEEIIMDAAGQSAEFGEWAEATNVGSTTLEQLDEDVRRIARAYLNNPPLPLMLTTLRVRNRVFTLLEGRQHPAQTRQLYLIAGRLCGLLAWMAGDVGRHAEAETQARTGWLCAELADTDGLRAWIRATQSKVAYWDGRVRESARLADDGLRFAVSDTARVMLASLGARAWARLGDVDAAHAALGRAEDERAEAGEDEVGGLLGFSEAQQSYLAGTTHLWLHEPAEALRAADRAVWLYEVGDPAERFYGAEMLALIDAATAHLQAGELEGASEKLAPVLALPEEQRLETFAQRLGEMRDELRRSRHAISRPAADIQRQIEDFRTGALGRYLGR